MSSVLGGVFRVPSFCFSFQHTNLTRRKPMSISPLTIEHQELKRCDLLRVAGRIDSDSAPTFEQELRSALGAGRYKIVLNLKGVDYTSSAALRVLINVARECRRFNRGDVRLAEVNDRVQKVLDLAGLKELFKLYATEAEAVGSF